MEISVKLFGGLRSYLPAGSSFNACTIQVDANATVSTLLGQLPLPADKHYMVIINDTKIDNDDFDNVSVSASDDVVLLPPIKGG
ncbi:MAG: molybdopterin synthase sulfur carrier subunit [Planctomycetota bacterium]|jgi:molybdopterin synthase sulfur carrier subunit